VEIVASVQRSDGSFSSPPVVSRDEEILQISSYDIAFALACLVLNEMGRDERETSQILLPSLARTFRLIQTMKETVRPPTQVPGHGLAGAGSVEPVGPKTPEEARMAARTYVGWASDTSRLEQAVAGWATARVLSFLVRYRDCLLSQRQQLVLSKYDVIRPGAGSSDPYWHDLLPVLSVGSGELPPSAPRQVKICDPTDGTKLTLALQAKLIEPVFKDPNRRPKNASFLVGGPAGTRKTSLVKGIASVLGWPLLSLTAADFLAQTGVMALHVAGSTIFADLLRLRRVVVLLEECEELIQSRHLGGRGSVEGASPIEGRMGSDFLRAGMLPRLQALRSRQWVIFALATRSGDFDTQLDQVLLGEGKFDFHILLHPPTLDAQCRYIRRELRRGYLSQTPEEDIEVLPQYRALVHVLKEAESSSDCCVSWSVLDSLIDQTLRPDMVDPKSEEYETQVQAFLEQALTTVTPGSIFDERT
jgi:hypothetical protein